MAGNTRLMWDMVLHRCGLVRRKHFNDLAMAHTRLHSQYLELKAKSNRVIHDLQGQMQELNRELDKVDNDAADGSFN